MNNEIFEKVKSFIVEIRGNYKINLDQETQLEKDLKITGDDASEFMEDFSMKFNVDISNLNLDEYFASEGTFSLYKLIFSGRKTGKKTMTIGDLVRGVMAGKLDDGSIYKVG